MGRAFGVAVTVLWVSLVWSVSGGTGEAASDEAACMCPCPCPDASSPPPSAEGEQEVPDTVRLDSLVEVYEAVEFSHGDHADMAEEGCGTCHHHASPGKYEKCGACHRKGLFESEKLNVLNLKAAYHRQCIECHVEWESGPTGCTECHEIRE